MVLYEPRMGKTVVTTKVMAQDPRTRVVLIACSKNAMNTWRDHIEGMFPQYTDRSFDVRFVKGKNTSTAAAARRAIWMFPRRAEITVYICTFSALERDSSWLLSSATRKTGLIFDTVVGDEVHIRMRNRKNKTVSMMKSFSWPKDCHRIHLLSGTMAGKWGPADFFACLNILAPTRFTSYWKFVHEHMEVDNNGFGMELIGIKDVKRWLTVLDQWSRRRFRKIDAPYIPAVQRALVQVDLTPRQRQLYDQLVAEDFAYSGENVIVAQNTLEKGLRLRQLMACPAMLDPQLGVGGALESLIERLTDEDATEEDRHTVIFTEFAKALPFFKGALEKAGFSVHVLQGGIDPDDLRRIVDDYRRTKGIMLCTIKYAQAFSLEPAKESHSIGYSWDPNENKQAEDRLVPQQGINPILANYYCYRDTYDVQVAHTVNVKNKLVSMTVGSHHEKQTEVVDSQ